VHSYDSLTGKNRILIKVGFFSFFFHGNFYMFRTGIGPIFGHQLNVFSKTPIALHGTFGTGESALSYMGRSVMSLHVAALFIQNTSE